MLKCTRYKAIGSQTGALKGSKDGFETLRVSQALLCYDSTYGD